MSRKALIVWGGWDGHQPKEVAQIFGDLLVSENFAVEVSDSLDAFKDEARLKSLDLIVPVWTMGKITPEQVNPVLAAVRSGVGIAGCHGGMCDSFRDCTEWQFMTGGQWVAHPGYDGVTYTVHLTRINSPIIEGMTDFPVTSEQYYMHVDPAVRVLATTRFPTADGPHVTNGTIDMPVVWTKMFGRGRVFYNSLGHQARTIAMPEPLELMRRGFLWAAEGKPLASQPEAIGADFVS
ncbi:MAG: ThuA domain-containing protein [Planctomycetota bacterium]|nr:ThuA domain-containing protein [Planctomycetota bacterium]